MRRADAEPKRQGLAVLSVYAAFLGISLDGALPNDLTFDKVEEAAQKQGLVVSRFSNLNVEKIQELVGSGYPVIVEREPKGKKHNRQAIVIGFSEEEFTLFDPALGTFERVFSQAFIKSLCKSEDEVHGLTLDLSSKESTVQSPIVPATRNDLNAIIEINKQLSIRDLPEFLYDSPTWIEKHIQAGNFYVVKNNGEIMGAISFEPEGDEFYIASLAVHALHQNEGYGTRLLMFAEHQAILQRKKKITGESLIAFGLQAYYEKMGAKVGAIKSHYGKPYFKFSKEIERHKKLKSRRVSKKK